MRLIDADYLTTEIARLVVGGKHAIEEAGHGNFWINGLHDVKEIIDNVPTIEVTNKEGEFLKPSNCDTCEDKAKSYSMGFQDGFLAVKEHVRPKGKWKIVKQDNEDILEIECPFCKYSKGGEFNTVLTVVFDRLPPFCENCGADMRGE